MPSLADHQSNDYIKLLLLGDAKCLASDTVVKVTRGRSIGKAMTLRDLYVRMSGDHYRFDPELSTYLLCDVGGYAGLGLMGSITTSGMKTVYQVVAGNSVIRATMDHQFLTDKGWLPLSDIKPGMWVKFWEVGTAGSAPAKPRVTIYSIPNHPFAMANWVNGKNYKRNSRARLVTEAAMNDMDFDDFIDVLRAAPDIAATLNYLPTNIDVHHKNGDTMDDSIENLEILDRAEHFAAEGRGTLTKPILLKKIESVSNPSLQATYDISMIDEGHNFIANGFVVHNSGKTGSLVSLVEAGYHLFILDFDNLLDVLKYYILRQCPDKIGNVEFRTLRDKRKASAVGPVIDGQPRAFVDAMNMLDNWKYKDDEGNVIDYGPPASWGPKCILVIDSLSRLCDAAYDFRDQLTPSGEKGKDSRMTYGDAQDAVENVLALLTSKRFATNVIVICHGTYMDMPDGTKKIFPQGVGQKLSPKIPQYFPNYIRYKNQGGRRTIQTVGDVMIDLANARPFAVKDSYPLETGLAEFFTALRNQEVPQPTSNPVPNTKLRKPK